jgi:lipopolysaccharide transport system ATP-binding protein
MFHSRSMQVIELVLLAAMEPVNQHCLKYLAALLHLPKGRITIHGRIASLLEVGTGFHPELTGRENIFLNGAILGMHKSEIKNKFDEIVAFSEVERFLDTPVKRYSSGMYVRLAFAVAAHLEPEILIVDEVLAVGDAEFQKKCIGKMRDVSGNGRTILFVSHNLPSLTSLCNKGLVLHQGEVNLPMTTIQDAVSHYTKIAQHLAQSDISQRTDRKGEGGIRFTAFSLLDAQNQPIDICVCGQTVTFKLDYICHQFEPKQIAAAIGIYGLDGQLFTVFANEYANGNFVTAPQTGSIYCTVEKFPLTSGKYALNLIVYCNGILHDWVQQAAMLHVDDGDFYGTGKTVASTHRCVLVEQSWQIA